MYTDTDKEKQINRHQRGEREKQAQRDEILGSRSLSKEKAEPGFEFRLVIPQKPSSLQETRIQKRI